MSFSKVFIGDDVTYSTSENVRDKFYAIFGAVTFEVGVLLGVCGFMVNVCDNLAIFSFNEDV